ncbi:E3 ubiquitin-protein ligase SINA-like 10 [Mercurialis annua]|uniref:E3 ubiquitin-protein ligase SINA-like 10 n=1 Tax=Mercurialis annua TaxID=3986 RepID=UPI00215E415A|nr:E3 ubiquitin-protein ligase SINA-like 10 [Mercurialis annua]
MARFSVDREEGETSNRRSRKRQRSRQPQPNQPPKRQPPPAVEGNYDDNHHVYRASSSEQEQSGPNSSSSEEEGSDSHTHVELPPRPSTNGAIVVSLIDPSVLDCPICYEPLSIPVFQCENGHLACSSCCNKIAHKCSVCTMPIGYNRCRAIEKVLESVKLPCQNLKYGCKELVLYSKIFDHDKVCNNVPCPCPLPSCKFVGSYRQLYQHFSRKHRNSAARFQFNATFSVSFTPNDKFLVLQEEEDNILFILKNTAEVLGNVITICRIGPPSLEQGCYYQLEARIEGSNIRFQSFTESIQKVDHDEHSDPYLIIPGSFIGVSRKISLDVCIRDHGCIPYKRDSRNLKANIKMVDKAVVNVGGNTKRGSSTPVVKKQKIQSFSISNPKSRKSATARVESFDTELLDCPICYEPFTVPIYQCENGHTACSSCCQRIANKCPSCALPIGSIRCRAIENVLESVKFSCKNVTYGCRKRMNYGEIIPEHENNCPSSPCPCPIPKCSHVDNSSSLCFHLQYYHQDDCMTIIKYGQTFTVSFTSNEKFLVLGVHGDSIFLLNNTSIEKFGNLITVYRIAPSSLKERYCYDLAAKIEGTKHTFRSLTKSISSNYEKQDAPLAGFLIDPVSAVGDNGKISLDVCIWNHTSKPAASIPSIANSA